MKEKIQIIFITLFILLLSACGSSESTAQEVNNQTLDDVVFHDSKTKVPTLVVIMNWTDYSENDPLVWYNKIFNHNTNSVNRWYYDSTDSAIELVPLKESSGTINDGIITVNMNKTHPGGNNDTSFRDTEIKNAITSSSVVDSVDFNALDLDKDGGVSASELQIIFIVSGGEMAFGDSAWNSIWAHSWSFASNSAPFVDNVYLMRTTQSSATSGNYSKFGATHGINGISEHKAAIGIIAHELGHSLFDLIDLYNPSQGHSGLGYYDIMSSGSWGKKTIDNYMGDTPTQFSAYSKIDTGIETSITAVSSTNIPQELIIKCSSNEYIKLLTAKPSEYFLIECRDSARVDSDQTFYNLDRAFTTNRLFALMYHVDTEKEWNSESGVQTLSNHYKVALVERDTADALTSTDGIKAKFSDSYSDGYLIDSSKTKSYAGVGGYNILVKSSDYTDRTMTFQITN